MMIKKRFLLWLIAAAALLALYAFSFPNPVTEKVITIFFPEETPAVAPTYEEWLYDANEVPKAWGKTIVHPLTDTLDPLQERYDDFLNAPKNAIDLKDPSVIEEKVEYDPFTDRYIITEKIGDEYFRNPTYMTFEEYKAYRDRKQQTAYFDRLQGASDGSKKRGGLVDPISKFNIRTSLIERLFGGTEVDIKPQGNINLTFGVRYERRENPILPIALQRVTNFDFDMDINMSASGKVGEKLNVNFNYNTQATFDFDNVFKIHYDPKSALGNNGLGDTEDAILQDIQAGNVSLPLRSTLIKGAANLFGVKTELKFGHLKTTLLAAQQRSRQQGITLQGGAQVQQYSVPIDDYDENRHFFVSQWNRSQFEPAMKCLPVPQSLFNITRMEVWVTTQGNVVPGQNTPPIRNIVGLTDLAEPFPMLDGNDEVPDPDVPVVNFAFANPPKKDVMGNPLPTNENNRLYSEIISNNAFIRDAANVTNGLKSMGLTQIRDFETTRAIQLIQGSEYTYNEQLGFISINRNVQPDDVVGVALEYTYNGVPYKIGEFGGDTGPGDSLNQDVIFLKMLKSTAPNVRYPIWDLMMKNVYSVGAVNVDPQEFLFDIFYEDPGKGQKRFLDNPALIPSSLRSTPLIQVFNLDNLNRQGDPGADGIFDFVPGLTVNPRTGRIMFPVLEPFGENLFRKLNESADPPLTIGQIEELDKKLLYRQLYDSTLFRAREFQQLNRFTLRGSYKSSTNSEISLGTFNLPPGSVRVSGGGRQLVEGQDYTIDYNIGKVRILNESILQSGQNINVSFEDNTLFGFNARTMLGARFDYEFSKHLTVGGTFMNLFERPLTQKVNFGDDPINNKVYGLDFNYTKEAPWLTKLVDRLPFYSTKAESNITASAEVAVLQPGFNKAINQGNEEGGIVYIDDFEGSTANIPLSFPANGWMIASVPQGDAASLNDNLFPENRASLHGPDSLALGANRARLAWYIADPSALDNNASIIEDNKNPYTRLFRFQDIFPNRQLSPLEQSTLRPLDVTIFPDERGPYNFDIPGGYPGISEGINSEGRLVRPETRWGGFMRGINNSSNDFEANNVEFIEFWMLNPYMETPVNGGVVSREGEMMIDLGTISEDVMRDSRQFFESGLPTPDLSAVTVRTRWGLVPALPPVVTAFDNNPSNREGQDVGLDGMDDEQEQNHYASWLSVVQSTLNPSAFNDARRDPSNDDFVHYRDGRFASSGGTNPTPGVLERYRNFNSPQGNTPSANGGGFNDNFVSSSTNLPDAEDLNRDNALNENESYFRYRIPLTKRDGGNQASEIELNSPDIADLITDTVAVDGNIWYRFKVPLDWKGRQAVNGIQDFRSIRFVRMVWRGFDQQTTFRFATLELGRNQWRRYTQALNGNGAAVCTDRTKPAEGVAFDVNNVNIEENAVRAPFNYTIPLGIQRENSVGAFPDILQNEQSLSMTVCNLPYCEGRGIFKTLNMDLRQFERIKMFAHAEPLTPADSFPADAIKIFIRLGSDFTSNYYEYEIPLIASDAEKVAGLISADDDYKREVWKNLFNFKLDSLSMLKQERNNQNYPVGTVFEKLLANGEVMKVIGNPNLGYVRGIMIGVVNRDEENQGKTYCFETWVNELRLVGMNNRGGYAGTARVDMKLADLGNISGAMTYTSKGWGGIDQRVLARQLEDVLQYDLSSTLNLDKFFPEKWGIRLPLYLQYSNLTRRPEYDPYDLDVKLTDKIRAADPADRDSIRNTAMDVTTIRGYNFTNVRKERRGKPRKVPLPWNIENFSLTYAFNEQNRRTPIIQSDRLRQYKGSLDYQYATGLKPWQPFKNNKVRFIKELNFNPLPETYGFNTELQRIAGTTIWRSFDSGTTPEQNTYYNRRLTWDRNYDLSWTIMKNLRLNFDANMRSLVDEPLTKETDRDSIWKNIRQFGRPKNYTQTAAVNYTLPFKNFKMLDWINTKASYTAGYTWSAQSLKLQFLETPAGLESGLQSRNLGHVIQNNVVRQINGDLNFEGLYNKSKYLSKINKPAKGAGGKGNKKTNAPAGSDENAPDGGGPGGRGGKTPGGDADSDIGAKDRKNTPPGAPGAPGDKGGRMDKNGQPLPDDGKGGNAADKGEKGEKKKKDRQPSMGERIALRPLMLVRKGRFTYSENLSSVVPGFVPETKFMGLSEGFSAPGWAFVFGAQPTREWLDEAGRNGWITQRPELNQQVMRNKTQNMDLGLTVEPFQDFRIEISATRQFTRNTTELYKDVLFDLGPDSVLYDHRAERDMGSYTTSFFSMKTLFDRDIDGLFTRFQENGAIISKRISPNGGPHDYPDDNPGYSNGFGKIHQGVLIPAFIAAYTDADPNTVKIGTNNLFNRRPALNWKLNYNGLSKVGKLNKIFSSVQISHGYKNTLTVSQYNTDIFYNANQPQKDEINANYIARFEIPQIVISEAFQPLLGLDMKFKNGMTIKADFKKSRTLAMSFVDYNLNETNATGYAGGFGHRIKNVDIPFLTGSKKGKSSSSKKSKKKKGETPTPAPTAGPGGGSGNSQVHDLNIKFDFEYRDDVTKVHSVQRPQAQPSRGTTTWSINPSVDYQLNRRLALRLFVDYRKTVPKTSQSFPITSVSSGVTVQFKLN
jgi:cell surface protein SprA